MKKILLALTVLFTSLIFAQETGSIVGKLTDKEVNNEPLAFANVLLKGTTKGTTSDFDGLYELDGLEPGSYTLIFSYLGYETVEIPDIAVEAGKVTSVNIPMSATEGVALDEVVVTTAARKDSEVALLLDQKKAVEIKTSIGAQELARKGVGNVATAVTKTTGISREEGSSNIFVRGLGDRYNITTLNGLPLPTNDPATKNIDLNIFSTDFVEYIGIDKTYQISNYGDFAGANIDIVTRNYNGDGFLTLKAGAGINTEATSVSDFYLTDGPGFSGFYTANYPASPLDAYRFTTSWDRETGYTPINNDISFMGGDAYTLGDNSRLNFFAVASYENGYQYREGVSRGGVNTGAVPDGDLTYTNYQYSTNTTLMGNVGLRLGETDLKYNIFYLNSTSQNRQEYDGIIDKDDNAQQGGGYINRSFFERTSLLINQLLGDHNLGETFEVHWGASYNISENLVPDRRQVTLLPVRSNEPDGPKSFQLISAASDNHRYYHTLNEDEFAANLSTTYKFKKNEDDEFDGKLTLGYNGRFKTVDFEATQFNFRITTRDNNGNILIQPVVDPNNVDAYFNQSILDQGYFRIETFRGPAGITNALDPQTYGGNQDIHAGYLSLEYALSPKFTLLAGIRGEQIAQTIEWSTSLDPEGDSSKFDSFEILPALSMKYELNDKQNLKFAASKTYTLPQYKERAFFLFQEVNQDYQGNPSLYASTDYNADLKWELFPKSDELVSLGVFGKYIKDPINTAVVNSASNDISYVNSGDHATAYGAELEVRKNLFLQEDDSGEAILRNNLSLGFNASYLRTDQSLDGEKVLRETTEGGIPLSVTFTEENDKISGASDLLLNGDLSFYKDFSKDKNFLATVAYNYFSDRIYALGVLGKGNIVDKGVGTLDLILKAQLGEHIGLGFDAKNLLNPTVERFQDIQDVTVLSYKKGSEFKLSLTYNF